MIEVDGGDVSWKVEFARPDDDDSQLYISYLNFFFFSFHILDVSLQSSLEMQFTESKLLTIKVSNSPS